MKLINWHRFTNTMIDFDNSTLISGENGAGKSTLLDAIQFVVTCSTNYFNKAAHEDDIVAARLGGDEFLYYMAGVSKEDAEVKISRIIKEFESKKENNTYLSVSSLSIGLCMTSVEDDFSDVIKKADRALYYVKQSGKRGYYFYNNEINNYKNKNSIDLKKLIANLKEQGAYSGTLSVEYREFAKLYDY